MCAMVCPFGTIEFSTIERRAVKCELCDGEPECVKFCVTGALQFKEPEADGIKKRRVFSEKLKAVYCEPKGI
jgi:Fe-S-cluster-containing hydrogenase component 2